MQHYTRALWGGLLALFFIILTATSLLFVAYGKVADAAPANTITITDKSGTAQTNYPLQFGRPFLPGEIVSYPQVLINGSPITTQADVKNRYPDGSVKYAVMAIIIPSISANGSLTLTFQNQSSGNNTALTQSQMLASNYNFDATIALTNPANTSQTVTASARQMLQDGAYSTWTSGQIAQTILLADDSAARKYDLGFDTYRPMRPRFYATFWPSLNRVTVRYAGEIDNTIALEDMQANAVLTIGSSNPQTVFTQSPLNQYAMSRWTKVFWLGGTPEQKINIDFNINYLKETKYFPNYDTSVTIPESSIASMYSDWTSKAKKPYDAGFWTPYMPTTGGRPDIAPIPYWSVRWLFTGDWRMREVSLGQADLASAWPAHLREGDTSLKFDRSQTISAVGKPISINARPNDWIPDNNGYNKLLISSAPRIIDTTKYPTTNGGWAKDGAHQPDAFYTPYILTGDPYYLEEAQLWAAGQAVEYSPGYRGGKYAGIPDQTRGNAWAFRNRVNTALITPDAQVAEKQFFNEIVDDAIAYWEGQVNVTGSTLQSHPAWQIARSRNLPIPPLRQIQFHEGTVPNEPLWQEYYLQAMLGWAKERGFATGALLTWLAPGLNGQFVEAGYDPKLLATYYTNMGTGWAADQFYTTWTQVSQGMTDTDRQNTINGFPGNEYTRNAIAAGAYTANEVGGSVAWNWLQANAKPTINYGGDAISFNILPRATNSTPLPPPTAVPTVKLTANPTALVVGNSSTLTWSSSGVNSCVGTGFTTGGATSGSVSVKPTLSTIYSITCSNVTASVSTDATISVTDGSPPPAINLSASPSAITQGDSSVLSWSVTGGTSCTGTNFTPSGLSGSMTLAPTQTTTYGMTCVGGGGVSSTTAKITVAPVYPGGSVFPAGSDTIIGTPSDETITAIDGIHYVDGLAGYNTLQLTQPKGSYSDWFQITQNADGTQSVTETHATGYKVTFYRIQKIVYPDGKSLVLEAPPVASFVTGDRVQTTANLNVRATASASGTLLGTQSSGVLGSIIGGPTTADGYNWWNINYDSGADGWSVQEYLVKFTSSAAVPTVSLSASPTSISAGGSATLTWSSTDATSCTGAGFIANSTSGSVTVSPVQTTTYSITCTGAGGTSQASTATVNVVAAPSVPTVNLSSNPATLTSGQSSTLSWSSTDATSCTGTGFTASNTSGQVTVTPTDTTTYSITCTGAGGSVSASTQITVTKPNPLVSNVSVTGDFVQTNDCSSLSIGSSCTISLIFKPSTTGARTGILSYFDGAANTTKSIQLTGTGTAVPTVPTATLSIAPTSIISGQTAVLSWTSTNATSCTGTNFTANSTAGQLGVSPTQTTTYSITCTGDGGTSPASSATIAVSVDPNASVFPVGAGTLIGTSADETLTAIDGIHYVDGLAGYNTLKLMMPSQYASPGWFEIKTNADGTQTVTDTHASGYAVTFNRIQKIIYPDGQSLTLVAQQAATVAPVIIPTPTVTLSANPAAITSGQSSTLSWSSTNATSCTGTGFTASATTGQVVVAPTQNTTYSVVCTGSGGTSPVSSVLITVAIPTTSVFAANAETLIGTDGDETLTAVGGIHYVDGLAGYNTLKLTQPNTSANSGWFAVTNNADGTKTLTDNHASGYKVTVYRIQKVIFPAGDSLDLSWGTTASTFFSKLSGLFGSIMHRFVPIAGGRVRWAASAALSLSSTAIDFGSVVVGQSSQTKNVTISAVDQQPAPGGSDTSAPSVPTTLTGSAAEVGGGVVVTLSWGASTDNVGVAGYAVYRNGQLLGTVSEKNFSDETAAWGTTYTYAVAAVDAAGNESAQASVSVKTPSQPVVSGARFTIGDRVKMLSNVNVRNSAGGGRVGGQKKGSTGTVIDGPVANGSYTWWKIDFLSGADGWVAEPFLQKN